MYYEIRKPFERVQFIHRMPSDEVVACYYADMHLSVSEIFQTPYVHHIYHFYLKKERRKGMPKIFDNIRDFFRAIRRKFKKKAAKFWKFLQEKVFPLAVAVIMERLQNYALEIVAQLNVTNLSGTEKQKQAFSLIKKQAVNTGADIKDSLINLLIEIAVTALKNEVKKI